MHKLKDQIKKDLQRFVTCWVILSLAAGFFVVGRKDVLGLVGAPTTVTRYYEFSGAGTVEMHGKYCRSWECDETIEKEFEITIQSSVVPTPTLNPVSWETDYVSLQADDFYINVGGKKYLDRTPDLSVHSDPITLGEQYTTLELIWHEQEREMRLFVYFRHDGEKWWATEWRTYDGNAPGNWLYYGSSIAPTPLGQTFVLSGDNSFYDLSLEKRGEIHFKNLRLQAFLDQGPVPSPAPCVGEGETFYMSQIVNVPSQQCCPDLQEIDAAVAHDDNLCSLESNKKVCVKGCGDGQCTKGENFCNCGGDCPRLAKEGEMCGGYAGIMCEEGLYCDYGDGKNFAPYPDASGVCREEVRKDKPICIERNQWSYGWSLNGEFISPDSCDPSCEAVCESVGSRSEGWYSSCDGSLILFAECSSASSDEEETCIDDPDGTWKQFGNGCADICGAGPKCTQALVYSCDCAGEKCWDPSAKKCEPAGVIVSPVPTPYPRYGEECRPCKARGVCNEGLYCDYPKGTHYELKKEISVDYLRNRLSSLIGVPWMPRAPGICKKKLMGDLNKDGEINVLDLSIMKENYNPLGELEANSGDLNGDGRVNSLDYGLLVKGWGETESVCPGEPVPITGCSAMTCMLYCEHGFKTDDKGCTICECREEP